LQVYDFHVPFGSWRVAIDLLQSHPSRAELDLVHFFELLLALEFNDVAAPEQFAAWGD
jgi:hypothetical protein